MLLRVVYVEPGKPAELKEVGDGLKDLQEAVGGYIEVVYPYQDDTCIICNEEGKINGLPINQPLMDDNGHIYDFICGAFIVAGLTEDNFGSLTDEQAEKYLEKYRTPFPTS